MSTGLFANEEDGYALEETKYTLKVDAPASETTSEPDSSDSDFGFGDSEGDEVEGFSDDEAPSDDKPFDDEPFDAGVEADEGEDPKKFIQQLSGKLGQSLRDYEEGLDSPDFELEKFAINSVISATNTSEMDKEDQEDIIKKVETSGSDKEVEDKEVEDKEVEPADSEEEVVDVEVTDDETLDEVSVINELDDVIANLPTFTQLAALGAPMLALVIRDILKGEKKSAKEKLEKGLKDKDGGEEVTESLMNDLTTLLKEAEYKGKGKSWGKKSKKKSVNENVDKATINRFLNDFAWLATFNLAKVQSYAKTDEAKNKLAEMQRTLNKFTPEYFGVIDPTKNTELYKPETLSKIIGKVGEYINYIKPYIEQFVKEGKDKDTWLKKIQDLSDKYLKIIGKTNENRVYLIKNMLNENSEVLDVVEVFSIYNSEDSHTLEPEVKPIEKPATVPVKRPDSPYTPKRRTKSKPKANK